MWPPERAALCAFCAEPKAPKKKKKVVVVKKIIKKKVKPPKAQPCQHLGRCLLAGAALAVVAGAAAAQWALP